MSLLEAQDLRLSYGNFDAVRGVTLQVHPGEVLSLIGPNGAGKTSTIHMLTGILLPTSGSVTVCGAPLDPTLTEARRRLAYVPDRPSVYEHLSVREYLTFVARLYGLPFEAIEDEATQLARRFRLFSHLDSFMGSFSHGMRQKAVLISRLALPVDVFVLDEPIVGLDPEAAAVLRAAMRERKERGAGILFSTHVLAIAEQVADRVAMLMEGTVIFSGTSSEMSAMAHASGLEAAFFRLTDAATAQIG